MNALHALQQVGFMCIFLKVDLEYEKSDATLCRRM